MKNANSMYLMSYGYNHNVDRVNKAISPSMDKLEWINHEATLLLYGKNLRARIDTVLENLK